MAIEIGIGIGIVIQKENDILIVMRRIDMETDVIQIEIAIAIVIVIACPIDHCPIRQSMTIRCQVICHIHDPFPATMMHPIDPMDTVVVAEAAAAEVADMATVGMTIVIPPVILQAVIPWAAILAAMLLIAYSRIDAIVPHPWTPHVIPMRQTHVDHPEDTMISYIVLDALNPNLPNDIRQPRWCPRAAPVNMPRLRIAFR